MQKQKKVNKTWAIISVIIIFTMVFGFSMASTF